jgi:hypothetical protein
MKPIYPIIDENYLKKIKDQMDKPTEPNILLKYVQGYAEENEEVTPEISPYHTTMVKHKRVTYRLVDLLPINSPKFKIPYRQSKYQIQHENPAKSNFSRRHYSLLENNSKNKKGYPIRI